MPIISDHAAACWLASTSHQSFAGRMTWTPSSCRAAGGASYGLVCAQDEPADDVALESGVCCHGGMHAHLHLGIERHEGVLLTAHAHRHDLRSVAVAERSSYGGPCRLHTDA